MADPIARTQHEPPLRDVSHAGLPCLSEDPACLGPTRGPTTRRSFLQKAGLATLATLLHPSPVLAAPPTISINGRTYWATIPWARSNNLSLEWLKPQHELRVGNARARFTLTAESRRVLCNNLGIWLTNSIATRDQDLYFPALDWTKTFRPLLFPRKRVSPVIKTICLDPGHGGRDTGKRDGNRYEKVYTLLLAREMGKLLHKAGYRVIYTRTTDVDLDLNDRPQLAQKGGADLFISLHFNGADTPSAQGAEVYCLTPVGASSTNAGGEGADSPVSTGNRWDEQNIQLAYQIHRLLISRLRREDRGIRRARFAVLREAHVPAVLIEAAFMSNPSEARWIYSEAQRVRLAQAIVDGIKEYRRIVE